MITISITSISVDDQAKALDFYTDILGFVKKTDVPVGEHRWLTLVSAAEQSGVELLLEPMAFEPAKVYQQALKDAGIPCTSFAVDNIEQEYQRLLELGVEFLMPPTEAGPVKVMVLDDTCGNYVQLAQQM